MREYIAGMAGHEGEEEGQMDQEGDERVQGLRREGRGI